MSVLACSRDGCTGIMCNRYHTQYGYLCEDCFEELVSRGVGQNISNFLDEEKEDQLNNHEAARKYFETIFPYEEREM